MIVADKKIDQIPYGTDTSIVNSVSQSAVEALRNDYDLRGKFIGLTTCRLNKEKGLDKLIRAVFLIAISSYNFAYLWPELEMKKSLLRSWLMKSGLQDIVTFLGWRTDTLNWMAASDLIFQPSLSESFCQVIIEGLMLEKNR
ncbi:MAG: glycosyltransferase [Chloracidobacterium sp.]|nr:glycosyltransferase [Chloracidobacterium sp.]